VKIYFLCGLTAFRCLSPAFGLVSVYLGFETRQSLAAKRVNPTQNPSGLGVSLFFPPKKGELCLSFFAH
jgi:hypothetical protein